MRRALTTHRPLMALHRVQIMSTRRSLSFLTSLSRNGILVITQKSRFTNSVNISLAKFNRLQPLPLSSEVSFDLNDEEDTTVTEDGANMVQSHLHSLVMRWVKAGWAAVGLGSFCVLSEKWPASEIQCQQITRTGVVNRIKLRSGGNNSVYSIAHRGGRVTAPENTVLAFQTAIETGADMIELE